MALFAPGLWWRLLVFFFSSPHRIGPDRQTGLILGSVAGAAVIQCAHEQPPALVAHLATRRSGSGDPAAVLVFYACGGRICVEGRRLVVDDGSYRKPWAIPGTGATWFENPDTRVAAEAIQVLDHAGLLMRINPTSTSGSYIGLTRLGMHALQTQHRASASRTQRRHANGLISLGPIIPGALAHHHTESSRLYVGGTAEALSRAMIALTAKSILRDDPLWSLAIRCPRESTFKTALLMCRASLGSPECVRPWFMTASRNACVAGVMSAADWG